MFFDSCKTDEEAKTLFRTLSKCLHPDAFKRENWFSLMKDEYDEFKPNTNASGPAGKGQFHKEYDKPKPEPRGYNPADPFAAFRERQKQGPTMTFGKHKGRAIKDSILSDPDYFDWLLDQEWFPERFP